MTHRCAGVDVSKSRLDVALWPGGEAWSVNNTAKGRAALVRRLAEIGVEAVAFEPTGGLERPLAAALADAGLPGRRVDAWRVRRFAEALGRRVKTDAVDAAVLARFAGEVAMGEPEPHAAADPVLRRLVAARGQLVAETVRLKAQAAQADDAFTAGLVRDRLALAKRQLAAVMKALRAHVQADPALRRRRDLLVSAPGVAEIAALTLMAELPELGLRDGKRIASLAGLAPHHRQSGRNPGRSAIAGGRAHLRRVLYMCALSAARFNPGWKAWREQLGARGKPKKVTLVAVMRKLLVTLNAMLKADQLFQPA